MIQQIRAANRPGHAFTGDGFDISAGIANRQDAVTTEILSPAGEFAGAVNFCVGQAGGDRLMLGSENFTDDVCGARLIAAGSGVKRGGQVFNRVIDSHQAHIAGLTHEHVDLAG